MTTEQMRLTILDLMSEGQGGYRSPDDIVRALNMGSDDKFNEERRLFEDTGHISDNMRNFKVSEPIALTLGVGSLPVDYSYRTNMEVESSGKLVTIVPDSDWVGRKNDPIDPPSEDYPIASINAGGVKVLPATIPSVLIHYLKRPATMGLTYTTNGNGDITITASQDTDWPDDCSNDLMLRGLTYLGVPVNSEMLLKLKSFKRGTEGV